MIPAALIPSDVLVTASLASCPNDTLFFSPSGVLRVASSSESTTISLSASGLAWLDPVGSINTGVSISSRVVEELNANSSTSCSTVSFSAAIFDDGLLVRLFSSVLISLETPLMSTDEGLLRKLLKPMVSVLVVGLSLRGLISLPTDGCKCDTVLP